MKRIALKKNRELLESIEKRITLNIILSISIKKKIPMMAKSIGNTMVRTLNRTEKNRIGQDYQIYIVKIKSD